LPLFVVDCVPDVASIPAVADIPLVPYVLTVAGVHGVVSVSDVAVIPGGRKVNSQHVHTLLAAERDTTCMSMLLAVERDTPCMSKLSIDSCWWCNSCNMMSKII
jgi:hypothetical protein